VENTASHCIAGVHFGFLWIAVQSSCSSRSRFQPHWTAKRKLRLYHRWRWYKWSRSCQPIDREPEDQCLGNRTWLPVNLSSSSLKRMTDVQIAMGKKTELRFLVCLFQPSMSGQIPVSLNQASTIALLHSTPAMSWVVGQWSMACSLLVEQPLIMMLGSNWEILDGVGMGCCFTSKRYRPYSCNV